MGNTTISLCTMGTPGSAIWDSSGQWEIIIFVSISAKEAGERWEGHKDSECLKQIQSKFSGNYFTEVASFAGMWPCSTLYGDNKLYKQSAAVGIFSNVLNIFLVSDNILFFLLFFNIISSVYSSIFLVPISELFVFYLFFHLCFYIFWLFFFANFFN